MRINVGIRRRLAPLVDNNRRRIELLNSLLLSFPGTPILYYGDEISMGDNIYLGDRNGVRTPMQWTSDRNAGFSKCDPARLYLPVVMDPVYGYQAINVEAQQSDQSSLLHWTRNMIALRKLFQVFGRGTLSFLNPSNRKVLAYLRELDQHDGFSEPLRTACDARPRQLRGLRRGRDAWLCAVPGDYQGAVFTDAGAVFLFVAGVAASKHGRRSATGAAQRL
jgi:maltose alpha-D-glucosyltransferase/alpha-amylase